MSIKLNIVKKRSENSSEGVPEFRGEIGNTDQSPERSHTRKPQESPKIHWQFTYNNYDPNEIRDLLVPIFEKYCKSYTFGKEIGASGTPHLQGRFSLKTKKRTEQLRKIWGNWHFEAERNRERGAEYVVKDCHNIEDVFTNEKTGNDSTHVKFMKTKRDAFNFFSIDEIEYNDEIEEWCHKKTGGCCDFKDLENIHNKDWWKFEIEFFWDFLDEFYYKDNVENYLIFMELYVL